MISAGSLPSYIMNPSEQANMFTETLFDENVGEMKEDSPVNDLDSAIEELSATKILHESSILDPDLLLSDFNSISFIERPELWDDVAKETVESYAYCSIGEGDLPGQGPNEGENFSTFGVAGPSAQRYGEPEVLVEVEVGETDKLNHPVSVSLRPQRRARNNKMNQNNEIRKSSRNCKKTAKKNLVLDLSSLKISTKKRSLFAQRARSSVWGILGNKLPDCEEQHAGLRIRNSVKNLTDQKAIVKTSTQPGGRISLKIKFGSQSCGTGNVSEKLDESAKLVPYILNGTESKLEEEVPGDLEVKGTVVDLCFSTSSDPHEIISQERKLGTSIVNMCSDPGTSPDSEVINSVPDNPHGLPSIGDSPIISNAGFSSGDVLSLNFPQMKGKTKTETHHVGEFSAESDTDGTEITDDGKENETSAITSPKMYLNTCCSKGVSMGPPGTSSPCSNGKKLPNYPRAKGGSKGKAGVLDSPGKRDKSSKKKGKQNILSGKSNVKEKGVANASCISNGLQCYRERIQTSSDLGETGDSNKASIGPMDDLHLSFCGVKEQHVSPRNAWVLCDECEKWRRIPAILADRIEETNCKWTCKDNTDKNFADCSIPQEKSNADINEELEISDGEDALPKPNQNRPKVAPQSSWSLIKSNLFLHRKRKTQNIDEVMVCHCKPPPDGKRGCGAKCLNRMLNIECVWGTCPCNELCSNQQFQRRKYSRLKWFKCGKKGHGLQALENISEGQFIIEYVGEVLDVHAHEARQREYALNGHKHFYFMTLNGSEVIDACAKGNLGRFINHSCDPNCRTEKWMVNGEVCIGLFAMKDIKKGEEVTFDYNYVRVLGAAAKKCVCGAPNCQGYIGGDPSNSEVIVQDDSDEDSEPLMTCEDKEMNDDWNDIMSNTSNHRENEVEVAIDPPEIMNKLGYDVGQLDSIVETQIGEASTQKAKVVTSFAEPFAETIVESEVVPSEKPSVQLVDISLQSEGNMVKSMPLDQNEYNLAQKNNTLVLPANSLPDKVKLKKNLKHAKFNPVTAKTHHSPSSVKKGKLKPNFVSGKGSIGVDALNAASQKSESLPEAPYKGRVETVEGKLNELLDRQGGVSKRKDASRGYLKLLFLTAASGNNGGGESIQSTRDLSMILDALLKTKSRTVLADIINKNGLQMLHNIMKRYRKEFIKTPILRKLLKVLEYLATWEILTLEHITGGPPRPGVESFKDSILTLTEHDDKQVHQIARNFRDRWIPRPLRRNLCLDARAEFPHHSNFNRFSDRSLKHSESPINNSIEVQPVTASGTPQISTPGPASTSGTTPLTNGSRTRKRKSRWDTPAEDNSQVRIKPNPESDGNDDDTPPGFSSPFKVASIDNNTSSTPTNHQDQGNTGVIVKHPIGIVVGDFQQRFDSRVPVSYGVPSSIIRQFGVQTENSEHWSIAPGVPYHPFPPLPPYVKGDTPTHSKENAREMNVFSGANEHPDFHQGGNSHSLGRKYFRQQRWNHSKLAPPWVRMRNGW